MALDKSIRGHLSNIPKLKKNKGEGFLETHSSRNNIDKFSYLNYPILRARSDPFAVFTIGNREHIVFMTFQSHQAGRG